MPHELIATARKLLDGEPSLWDMRRAVSSAYYALFHFLCAKCSDSFVGPEQGAFTRAKRQAYRSIDHGAARAACVEARNPSRQFPTGIADFALTFTQLQEQRHLVDYDPMSVLTKDITLDLIDEAENAMSSFDSEDEMHQRAFLVFVALRNRLRGLPT
jgi:hypothetical protein